MRLIYAPTAEADLTQIFDYIAVDDPRAAERTILRIEQTLSLVAQFPEIGHTGDILETREFIVPNIKYRIVYKIEDDTIRVLNIVHSSRQWP